MILQTFSAPKVLVVFMNISKHKREVSIAQEEIYHAITDPWNQKALFNVLFL